MNIITKKSNLHSYNACKTEQTESNNVYFCPRYNLTLAQCPFGFNYTHLHDPQLLKYLRVVGVVPGVTTHLQLHIMEEAICQFFRHNVIYDEQTERENNRNNRQALQLLNQSFRHNLIQLSRTQPQQRFRVLK